MESLVTDAAHTNHEADSSLVTLENCMATTPCTPHTQVQHNPGHSRRSAERGRAYETNNTTHLLVGLMVVCEAHRGKATMSEDLLQGVPRPHLQRTTLFHL